MKKLTIDHCHKLASQKGGQFLDDEYINSKFKHWWKCSKNHIFKATYNSIFNRIIWCSECRKQNINIKDCKEIANKRGGRCLSDAYIDSTTKCLWECAQGHRWKAPFSRVRGGSWCKLCYQKSYTINDCCKIAKQKGGRCLSKKYISVDSKYLWECSKQHRWEATFYKVKNKTWCPKCANVKKLTLKECNEIANSRSGKFLSDKYINAKTKYLWKCKIGHKFKATMNDVKYGKHWCSKCAGNQKHSIRYCQELALTKNGKFLSTSYINSHTKCLWQCEQGHTWEAVISMIELGYWCLQCAGITRHTLQSCIDVANLRGGKCLSKKYINSKNYILWECANKHQWRAAFEKIKQGTWCPKCRAKTQTKIFKYCKKLFPNCDIKYNFKGFNWLKTNKGSRMELDIYIPELKLAIEYDGEQHFQPIKWSSKTTDQEAKDKLIIQQKRDKLKNELVKKSEEVDKLIRFNYTEDINLEYIKSKISEAIL